MRDDKSKLKTFFIALYLLFTALAFFVANGAEANDQIEKLIISTAEKYGIDPELALAIAQVESSMNPNAIGPVGEVGLFQLRPEYHSVRHGDVEHNVHVAIRYLQYVKSKCEGKYGEAWFIGFNLGPYYAKPIRYPTRFIYYRKVKSILDERRRTMVAVN